MCVYIYDDDNLGLDIQRILGRKQEVKTGLLNHFSLNVSLRAATAWTPTKNSVGTEFESDLAVSNTMTLIIFVLFTLSSLCLKESQMKHTKHQAPQRQVHSTLGENSTKRTMKYLCVFYVLFYKEYTWNCIFSVITLYKLLQKLFYFNSVYKLCIF